MELIDSKAFKQSSSEPSYTFFKKLVCVKNGLLDIRWNRKGQLGCYFRIAGKVVTWVRMTVTEKKRDVNGSESL